MSSPTYAEKLRDPRWQRKRLEVMGRDNFACCHCGEAHATLNVHHTFYRRNTSPWEYPDDSLLTLCEPCHERVQAWMTAGHRAYGRLELGEAQRAIGYMRAMHADGADDNDVIVIESYFVAHGVADYYRIPIPEVLVAALPAATSVNGILQSFPGKVPASALRACRDAHFLMQPANA